MRVVLKIRNPETGRMRLLRNEKGEIVLFSSFRKATHKAEEIGSGRDYIAKRIF